MPIYDYKCPKCGKQQELLVYRDIPITCPECMELMVKLIPLGTSFILSGEGWYKDGYSSSKK